MSIEAAIALYVLGILIGTIGFGAYMHPKRNRFDNFDFVLFMFIVLLWPILLFCAVVVALVVGTCLFIIFKPLQFLMYKGEDWCKAISEWWEDRKFRKNSIGKEFV